MNSGKFRLEHWQKILLCLVLYDIAAVNAAYVLAIALRFDFVLSTVPYYYIRAMYRFLPIYTVVCIGVFWVLKLYHSIWRFASYTELSRVMLSSLITGVIHAVGITVLFQRMPVSYYVLGAGFQFVLVLGVRFFYRFILLLRSSRDARRGETTNIMLIGAGEAGHALLRDIRISRETEGTVRCIIDDNPNKWGRDIDGVPIVGGRDSILRYAEEYKIDRIFIAIPSADAADKRDILSICKETGCELKNLPGMYQLVNGEISVRSLRDVAIEDLLGRDPIRLDMTEVDGYLGGKTVLVTGGGGSIGSELCRQIAARKPGRLIIFDVYENNAYEIQQELSRTYPDLPLTVLIGSVRDSKRLESVFETYRPQVVYHAAAHKHVPLMEESPCEAIKNNTAGTYKTAWAAMHHGCERFVLISTDKAVNPTNVMGASKRVCEMVVQMFDRMIRAGRGGEIPPLSGHDIHPDRTYVPKAGEELHTRFSAVRFGNVLGSNGSVIPLFKKAIAAGGPVYVTDPRVIRYFMTVQEAVSLVLQAGVMGHGSEIYVLDMGSPVKIDDLARNLIKLSGLRPDEDIKIEYIGLRPGEKLFEEKLMAEEGLQKTANDLIFVGKPLAFDEDKFLKQLFHLFEVSLTEDPAALKQALKETVLTYRPADELYAAQAEEEKAAPAEPAENM